MVAASYARPAANCLVLRFPPGGPDDVEQIRKEAKYNHRHHQQARSEPWYRLSVWVTAAREGELEEQVLLRLVRAAGIGGIRLADLRNRVCWTTTAGRLYELGFDRRKDGDEGEPQEHFSVDLGESEPARHVIVRFVSAFIGPRQTSEET